MNDDYDYDKDLNAVYKVRYACLVGIILCIALSLLTGCKSTQYVPVVEYHTDSIYVTRVEFDSIYVKDSTNQKEYSRNDTFFIEKTKWLTKYKEKLVHDTLYQSKVDSIPVPYEVPAKLTKFEQLKVNYGGWAILLTFLFFIYGLIRVIRRFLP